MLDMENLTEYRRRLRVLLEDMALTGIVVKLDEIYSTWKRGLLPLFKEWLLLIEKTFPNPGTPVEVIYRLERLVKEKGGGIEIDDIVFIVSAKSVKPLPPDFRFWEPIGRGKIYAHDVRSDHMGVRDTDPFTDDQMLDYALSAHFSYEDLMAIPSVIPEGHPVHMHGAPPHTRQTVGMSHPMETPSRAPREDQSLREALAVANETYNQVYNAYMHAYQSEPLHPDLGPPFGGWIPWEEEHPEFLEADNRDPVVPAPVIPETPMTMGIRIREPDPIQVPQQDQQMELEEESEGSQSDSNSVEVFPDLDPKDKGKRPLYHDPGKDT